AARRAEAPGDGAGEALALQADARHAPLAPLRSRRARAGAEERPRRGRRRPRRARPGVEGRLTSRRVLERGQPMSTNPDEPSLQTVAERLLGDLRKLEDTIREAQRLEITSAKNLQRGRRLLEAC